MIIGGKHRGKFGRITAIEEGERKLESLITVEGEVGERFQTALKYVFVIGSEQPSISIPKVAL
ncbi:MAG: 30S ribosomal protein S4e, partial [Candidatus Bathyarchaeia archaeon]